MCIEACTQLSANATQQNIAATYISLCSNNLPAFSALYPIPHSDTWQGDQTSPTTPIFSLKTQTLLTIFARKKYKPIACKIRPIETELPSQFCIICDIKGHPLETLPHLNPRLPNFKPTGQYTTKRCDQFEDVHTGNFLLPEERKLVHHFMCLQNGTFVWSNKERRYFREDFFLPIDIPTLPHKPWAQRNIPIPPRIYDKVCRLIKHKIDASMYKPSNSSYQSRWFCIVKKDSKLLRIMQSRAPQSSNYQTFRSHAIHRPNRQAFRRPCVRRYAGLIRWV